MKRSVKEWFDRFTNSTFSSTENKIKVLRTCFDNYGKVYVDKINRSNTLGNYMYKTHICHKDIPRSNFDILTGLYFPPEFYSSGDIIDMHVGTSSICKITIDSPGRIYKPFMDFQWIYMASLFWHDVEILTNDRPFYAIGICIHETYRNYLSQVAQEHVAPNGTTMRYISGMGGIGEYNMNNPDAINNMYSSYPYIYAANLIKKHMRAYHERLIYEKDMWTIYI